MVKAKILSTKKLSFAQRELLLNANFSLTQYNAIQIKPIDFEVLKPVKNAIITSKNAAKAVIEKQLQIENCFCVGEKTSALLTQKDIHVKNICHSAKMLAEHIVQNFKTDAFTFFSGSIRRDELPVILKEHQVELQEITVYDTVETNEKVKGFFNGILFFSPSAVRSFFSKNSHHDATLFCIGKTTAEEALNFSKNIIIATKPTIENTIVQVVKYFK